MTLSDLELFQAELEHAVAKRQQTKKVWESWAHWIGEKGRKEVYRYTGVSENER